jgi:type III restriction enzyme
LQGLARYAETHSQIYRRIVAVAETSGKMRVLDVTRANVRKAVLEATNAEFLYTGAAAGDYESLDLPGKRRDPERRTLGVVR